MGMAASQARLLSITSRIHDVEYQAQQIQSAKMALALQEDEVYRKYNEALDAQTLTFRAPSGNLVKANFNNLFGVDSIKNGLTANYILRNSSDEVVVPDDVWEAYNEFAGNAGICDPYAFAMVMVTDITDSTDYLGNPISASDILMGYETEYLKNNEELPKNIANAKENLENNIKKLFDFINEKDDNKETPNLMEMLYNGGTKSVGEQIDTYVDITLLENSDYKEIKNNIIKAYDEFRNALYSGNVKNKIYAFHTEDSDAKVDDEKFNYYLRYAKIIQEEGGIDYVSHPSEYEENFATDAELFNQMLMSGKLTLEIVELDKKGNVNFDPTSPSADSNIAYNNESSVDSRALKKAEAEYEYAMKKIDKKDKQYDMDLNRLETERSALTTEYDSVKQVIKDNIERTFKIFS